MPNTAAPTATFRHNHLSDSSTPYVDPLVRVNWESLGKGGWWMPESALSLFGIPAFRQLSEAQRCALSRYEFLHLLNAGLWLEGLFMQRLSRALHTTSEDLAQTVYQLHEIREEAGHSLMFLELIRRSGLRGPSNPFLKLRLANWLGRYTPFDSYLFWVAVLIGESVPDSVNRYLRKHRDSVCSTVYDITHIHVVDEARHISHAGHMLQRRRVAMPSWQMPLLQPIVNQVFRQFVSTFFFPKPEIYELAGLQDSKHWARVARTNPNRKQFVQENVAGVVRLLNNVGAGIALPTDLTQW
jgi:hypothetical protein